MCLTNRGQVWNKLENQCTDPILFRIQLQLDLEYLKIENDGTNK
jgi:hypothetical protein